MPAKVYFTDLKVANQSLPDKMERLVRAAGIESLDCKDKFTAVKIHFGEPGNVAYIRHNYALRMTEILRSLGARVFYTDSGTLYSGRRANALYDLTAAYENGYNPLSVGAHVVIADGLKGTEYRELPGATELCRTCKIGTAVAEADVIVSMTHFKGHEMTGFGGALKNLGMGAASRGGKLDLHSTSKPRIDRDHCTGCRQCVKDCNYGAVTLDAQKRATIDYDKCVGCGQCIAVCRFGAALPVMNAATDTMNRKIAEYTLAVLRDKPHFHVSFIMDVSPECDCWGHNDVPIVPNIGIAASFDPVALDQACADLVTAAPVMAGSRADTHAHDHGGVHVHEDLVGVDKFDRVHPDTDWRTGLDHAEKIGLGTRKYELVRIK